MMKIIMSLICINILKCNILAMYKHDNFAAGKV